MGKFVSHNLNLTKEQARKLANNKHIILKPSQMEGGSIEISIQPNKLRKIMTAMKKQKGLKFSLNQDELEKSLNGEGFKDLMKKGFEFVKKEGVPIVKDLAKKAEPIVAKEISKVASKYIGKDAGDAIGKVIAKEGVKGVDKVVGGNVLKDIKKVAKTISSGYKKYVKDTPVGDVIRKGAKTALVVGATELPALVGQPELAPITGALANKYGDKLIKKAGLGLKDDHSNILSMNHPAMKSHIPIQGITDIARKKGGSFLPAGKHGGSFLPAGRGLYISNDPMKPSLPLQGISDIPRDKYGKPLKDFIQPSTPFF